MEKKSLFDKIKVPLEDVTEEEQIAYENDPEFQKWLAERQARHRMFVSQLRQTEFKKKTEQGQKEN